MSTQPITVADMAIEKQNNNYRSILQSLTPNAGAQILRYGWKRPNVLSLGQGEGSFATPDFITKAAYEAMQDGKTFYGPVLGQPALRQELSNYYTKIYDLALPTNRIFVTGSGTTAMHLSLTAILDEGDEVVAVTPIWKNLLGAAELAQAKVIQVPLDHQEDGWNLDLDKLFDACTHKTKAILVVTPSNPTGWMMKKPQMEAVMEFARARGIWVISDEVYGRIVYDGSKRAPSFLDVSEPEDRLFTINSFSKSWAMTGWRLGWIVGPACAEEPIRDIALYDNMGPATFVQFGAVEALRKGEDFIAKQTSLWKSNLDLLMDRFQKNDRVQMTRPEATFYGFFTVDGEDDCMALAKQLIDEGALSLAPGCAFGSCCKSYMRLVFAVSEEKLIDALDRFENVINQ